MDEFKIRCSQIGKIMGRMGLTENQLNKMNDLEVRQVAGLKPLTANMVSELAELKHYHENAELPQTCKTYLHEWYAGDYESIYTKEINKGNMVELDLIEFMCDQLGLGVVERNLEPKWDDYITGTCDVDCAQLDAVIDVKAPWNKTTLHSNISGINEDYKWQGIGYCHLWKRSKFILFYGLMDTPEDVNYGKEVVYSELPADQRWIAYQVNADPGAIELVKERVKLCRKYLAEYDLKVKEKMGRITVL